MKKPTLDESTDNLITKLYDIKKEKMSAQSRYEKQMAVAFFELSPHIMEEMGI